MPAPKKPMSTSGTVSSAQSKKPLLDKYGRTLTPAEAAKRKAYRERLSQMSSPAAAAAARKKEMARREEFRKTTSLRGAKGPGKAQAQLEASRMSAGKKSAGSSVAESRRMSAAMSSKKAAQTKAGVQRARMTNRARRAGM